MLADAIHSFIAVLHNADASEREIISAAQPVFEALPQATPEQVRGAFAALSSALDLPTPRAGYAAMLMGALIEQGYPPDSVIEPLLSWLQPLLQQCSDLARAAQRIMPAPDSEADQDGPSEAFETACRQLAPTMPQEMQAWDVLDRFWPPGIALLSASQTARSRGKPLRPLAQASAKYHSGAHWLDLMLSVLDDEPILVIEPGAQLGFRGRMTGVVDNFQLHTLLTGVFPEGGLLHKSAIPQSVFDVARGTGPQETDDTVTGVWNLYAWTAIQPDLTLPSPQDRTASRHWIWGEGQPEDIPVFEEQRVVLLGPPAYVRSWPSQRMFSRLQAEIHPDQVLTPEEIRSWLGKMAAASQAN